MGSTKIRNFLTLGALEAKKLQKPRWPKYCETPCNRKCRICNWRYCKYKQKCKFVHPLDICEEILRRNRCESSECPKRHPRTCKWEGNGGGCRRDKECAYLHQESIVKESLKENNVNVANVNVGEYKCVSCRYTWNDSIHVVTHDIQNMKL